MSLFRWIKHFCEDPEYRLCKWLLHFVKPEYIPDKMFLKYQYHYVFGKELDLKNPKTYNEKIQWLKLYDRNPLYTMLVDKYAVKEWVSEKIGEQFVIPTLTIYDSVEQINLNELPNRFVLKCTHDSGSVIICKDKQSFNLEEAKRILNQGLEIDFYKKHREWPYKNVPRRIIAEQYLEDDSSQEVKDYKFYCMNGCCKSVLVITKKQESGRVYYDYFDSDFKHMDFTKGHPNSPDKVDKPLQFELMKELSQKLSEGIINVRCDFYEVNDRVYFGEMTFFPAGGIIPFNPQNYDLEWGSWIKLPNYQS